MRLLTAIAMLCIACSQTSSRAPTLPDARPSLGDEASVDTPGPTSSDANASDGFFDGALSDAMPCTTPETCSWVEDYERDVVARLSGARPITAGVTLTRRSSPAQREATRAWLLDAFRALGLEADFHVYPTGQNVRARLPATTPTDAPRIVVGAHYDGVPAGPAAADDGTGVALVLAAARYLAGLPRRDRPVEFVLFDQEEVGLVGSAAYATALRMEGISIEGAHCFDMISHDGDGDRAIELWSPSPHLRALYELHGARHGVPVRVVRFTSSDHQSFLSRSLPAVGIGEEFVSGDHTPHYHRATDTYEQVDFAYLARTTRLVFDVLADHVTD
jgi:hypothetical protein